MKPSEYIIAYFVKTGSICSGRVNLLIIVANHKGLWCPKAAGPWRADLGLSVWEQAASK